MCVCVSVCLSVCLSVGLSLSSSALVMNFCETEGATSVW